LEIVIELLRLRFHSFRLSIYQYINMCMYTHTHTHVMGVDERGGERESKRDNKHHTHKTKLFSQNVCVSV
jgi:hypothetical protein